MLYAVSVRLSCMIVIIRVIIFPYPGIIIWHQIFWIRAPKCRTKYLHWHRDWQTEISKWGTLVTIGISNVEWKRLQFLFLGFSPSRVELWRKWSPSLAHAFISWKVYNINYVKSFMRTDLYKRTICAKSRIWNCTHRSSRHYVIDFLLLKFFLASLAADSGDTITIPIECEPNRRSA